MIGRTHDLAAFTALNLVVISYPLPHVSLATTIVAVTANLVGGLTPDIDQPTAALYHKLPVGSLIGKLIAPLFGGHRFISHSIFGIFLFGFGFKYLLGLASHSLIVNMDVVWWAFMIGFISHIIMDTFTKEGVPWFFPIPIRLGIPPLKALRVKTGGFVEKLIIFPALLLLDGYIYYLYYGKFLDIFHHT